MQQSFIRHLKNGMRVLYDHNDNQLVTHCALLVRAGTRDEPNGKEGLAHFIEHTLFKGTKKRRAFHILNQLEIVGGELNAYTTKEETCLHASVMNMHLERAVELIADIAFNANFPQKELLKEKEVILDEILAYEDMPYEQVYDDFETLVFKGHPLGHPILGTIESVRNFKRSDILKYIHAHYNPGKMVFAVSGNAGIEKVMSIAEKYFEKMHIKLKVNSVKKFNSTKTKRTTVVKNIKQVHFITGCPAYGLLDEKRYAMILLNNILGGPGMNSKLNLNIRERYGYTYNIESGYHAYTDCGLFHIYFATDEKNFVKVQRLVEKEVNRIVEVPLSERNFSQYKRQLIGQVSISQENRLNLLLGMAKSLLYFKKVLSLEEVAENIDSVTLKDFMKVANEILQPEKFSSLTFMPAASNN